MAHEKRRAAIDKALGDAVVQRVGQPVLDAAGALLPLGRALDPVAAMRDVGPGADMGDARHQRIDIAVEPVELRHLAADPGGSAGARSGPARWTKQCARNRAWLSLITLRKSGIWQTSQSSRTAPGLVARPMTSALRDSSCNARWSSASRTCTRPGAGGRSSRLLQQRADRVEAQPRVAPRKPGQRLEAMLLDRRDDLRFEQPLVGRGAERAVCSCAGRRGRRSGRFRPATGGAGRARRTSRAGRRRHGRDPC